MPDQVLIRYGKVPEVAKFAVPAGLAFERDEALVVRGPTGAVLGEPLEPRAAGTDEEEVDEKSFHVLRLADETDRERATALRMQCEAEFVDWLQRIEDWNLELDLIDIDRTLDGEKLILYVLGDRGNDTTKLALMAATKGFGVIEVQPVSAEGPIPLQSGGGCGNCKKH
ncbi:PSP1 C-terminal domain-containing protein [Stratiformator vulcanicus]|uniref:Uncharacterized protein n=1 Tax=Stratiformator vulcanicus TaxID=2527980 RepID=A0A517R6P5_9PLAN|nr:PSP1 C-terminal domain-containing protein [Stratiformator vulcanicus]QDT39550.1 hypothetical protein Pan189_39590 [Stratiformator vulcanicus]